MSPRTVAVLGGLVQDLVTIADRIPDQGETIVANKFNSSPGGKGANSAVAVYRLSRANPKNQDAAHTTSDDLHVRMIGAVGRDQFGPGLKEAVHRSGVNVDGVQEIEGQSTALGIILIEQKSGENRILLHQNAANAIKPEQFMTPESLGAGVKPDLLIAQLEIRRDTIEQAIETAHHHGIEVLLNPAPACYIDPVLFPMITHLIVNETESKMLSHSTVGSDIPETEWSGITDYFHNLGVQNVVITLGDKGAFYSHENKDTKDRHRGHVDAEKGLKVLDSAGAG
ncbi:putative ribokinase [Neodidymelliopsis sp. IMI 364377]|nr:putative ribokinase [Neodidymelliopsis sp. IMI 364377]